MKFTLVTAKGKIMKFFVEDIAKLYQSFEGGVLITIAE
jgi:hypothetical protein